MGCELGAVGGHLTLFSPRLNGEFRRIDGIWCARTMARHVADHDGILGLSNGLILTSPWCFFDLSMVALCCDIMYVRGVDLVLNLVSRYLLVLPFLYQTNTLRKILFSGLKKWRALSLSSLTSVGISKQ